MGGLREVMVEMPYEAGGPMIASTAVSLGSSEATMAMAHSEGSREEKSDRFATAKQAPIASGAPLVFMFPGQSSRDAQAIERLAASNARCAEILGRASDLVARDLNRHYRSGNPDIFRTNQDVQVGIFLANYMYAELLREAGVTAELSMGLSLGEYNHLVEIGALAWDEALRLVAARGAAYDAGPEGAMAVFSSTNESEVRRLLSRAATVGVAEISNYNTPTQFVIAGERNAIEAALVIGGDEFFLDGMMIEQRIPMHCQLFATVGDRFRTCLMTASWRAVPGPYIANVTGTIVENPTAQLFIECLARHVCEPVLWRQSVEAVAARHAEAIFIEVGPQSVLFNLLHPRWIAHRKFRTGNDEEPQRQVERIAAELQGLTHVH